MRPTLRAFLLSAILIGSLLVQPVLAYQNSTVCIPGPCFTRAYSVGHTFSAPASANNRCYNQQTSVASPLTCTLGTAPATGTLTVVTMTIGIGNGLTTCSDGTNSYAYTPNSPSNVNETTALEVGVAYWFATTTGGATITCAWSGGNSSFVSIRVDTFGVTGSGAVVLDTAVNTTGDIAGNGSSGTAINTPTITSPTNGDLLIGAATVEGNISSSNSPWTEEAHGVGGLGEDMQYILASSGTQAINFTQTTGHWDSLGVAFK